MHVSDDIREIHRVPGEWRCIQCGTRVSTSPDAQERPACPHGCDKRCVPMSWKLYGPEQQQQLAKARTAALDLGKKLQGAVSEREVLLAEVRRRDALAGRWRLAALLGAVAWLVTLGVLLCAR